MHVKVYVVKLKVNILNLFETLSPDFDYFY